MRRSAIKAIHGYVFRLRKCTFDYVIVSEGSRYALNMDAVDIDAVEFERDLRDASDLYLEGRFGDALRLANAGLGKWKGSPYEGVSEAVLRAGEIRRLVEIWFRLREVRTQAQFAIGQFNASIGALEEEVATEPLREQSWFFLMTALHHTGRSVEALAAYSRARRVLAEALGIEPSRLLQLAEMRVLKNEPLHDLVLQGVRFAS